MGSIAIDSYSQKQIVFYSYFEQSCDAFNYSHNSVIWAWENKHFINIKQRNDKFILPFGGMESWVNYRLQNCDDNKQFSGVEFFSFDAGPRL